MRVQKKEVSRVLKVPCGVISGGKWKIDSCGIRYELSSLQRLLKLGRTFRCTDFQSRRVGWFAIELGHLTAPRAMLLPSSGMRKISIVLRSILCEERIFTGCFDWNKRLVGLRKHFKRILAFAGLLYALWEPFIFYSEASSSAQCVSVLLV